MLSLACEPIPILMISFGGPAASASFFAASLAIFFAVVLLKAGLFALLSPLPAARGFLAMLSGNVVSTVPGILVGGLLTGSGMILPGLVAMLISCALAGPFFVASVAGTRWASITQWRFTAWSFAMTILSVAMGVGTMATDTSSTNVPLYWAMKVAGLYFGLLAGIALTAAWEGMVVARFAPEADRGAVLTAAVRANLYVFLPVVLVGALIAWPIRRRRSDFLWLAP